MSKSNLSLGLIETYGMPTAVQAADAMCKAADVNIAGFKKIGSGLVTVYVQGEVGAVQVAVESGVIAAERVGKVVASLVIARPDQAVTDQLAEFGGKKKAGSADKIVAKTAASSPVKTETAPLADIKKPVDKIKETEKAGMNKK